MDLCLYIWMMSKWMSPFAHLNDEFSIRSLCLPMLCFKWMSQCSLALKTVTRRRGIKTYFLIPCSPRSCRCGRAPWSKFSFDIVTDCLNTSIPRRTIFVELKCFYGIFLQQVSLLLDFQTFKIRKHVGWEYEAFISIARQQKSKSEGTITVSSSRQFFVPTFSTFLLKEKTQFFCCYFSRESIEE